MEQNDEEQVRQQLYMLARLVDGFDFDLVWQALQAQEPGPRLTPGNYQAARGKLARLNRLARAMRRLRKAARDVLKNRV